MSSLTISYISLRELHLCPRVSCTVKRRFRNIIAVLMSTNLSPSVAMPMTAQHKYTNDAIVKNRTIGWIYSTDILARVIARLTRSVDYSLNFVDDNLVVGSVKRAGVASCGSGHEWSRQSRGNYTATLERHEEGREKRDREG